MLTLCQLLKMESVQLNHCGYKGVLMAVRIPVIDHLHNRQDGRKQELFETKAAINLPILICRTLWMQFCFILSSRIKGTSFRKFKAFEKNIKIYFLKLWPKSPLNLVLKH